MRVQVTVQLECESVGVRVRVGVWVWSPRQSVIHCWSASQSPSGTYCIYLDFKDFILDSGVIISNGISFYVCNIVTNGIIYSITDNFCL